MTGIREIGFFLTELGGTGSVNFDGHPVSGNPAFASAPSDFHLTTASAAIDMGSAAVITLVTNDYDAAVPRPIGASVDIGAYEYAPGYVYDRIFDNGFE